MRGTVLALSLLTAALGASCAPHRFEASLGRLPTAQEMAQLWVEPKDLEQRDLFYGVGGAGTAPDPTVEYRFLTKKKTGRSPGYTVSDPKGMKWTVKLGPEAQAELVASRVVWAVGYHQPPVYVLQSWSVSGGPEPGPQKGPGRFRPHLPGWKEAGSWSWYRNPFVGSRPYRGLIVLMRVLNNWDLLNRNNLVYDLKQPFEGASRLYVVKDLGASLGGAKGLLHQGTKNEIEHFEKQRFIDRVEGGSVHFEDKGRRHRELYKRIPPEDVRWMCGLLARLTPTQWRDAFRAAAYDEPTAERFIRKLQERIAEGLAQS